MLRRFANTCGWTPRDVLEGHTFAEFLFLWAGGAGARGHDPDAVRNKINKLRAKKGLPPMKPRKG